MVEPLVAPLAVVVFEVVVAFVKVVENVVGFCMVVVVIGLSFDVTTEVLAIFVGAGLTVVLVNAVVMVED